MTDHTHQALATLQAARAGAAQAYGEAAGAYVSAAVELSALDTACANGNLGGQPGAGFGAQPQALGHPLGLPNPSTANAGFVDRVQARVAELLDGAHRQIATAEAADRAKAAAEAAEAAAAAAQAEAQAAEAAQAPAG